MTSDTQKASRQIIRIEPVENSAEENGPCGLGIFPTPCRILCGKGETDDSVCLVHEKLASLALKERFCACAEKTATRIREQPLKSLAVIGIAGVLLGMLLGRKN